MKNTSIRSAALIALIAMASFSQAAYAVGLAPEDLPSSVELEESDQPTAEGIRNGTFPEVDVENPTKPSDQIDDSGEITFVSEEEVAINEEKSSDVFAAGGSVVVTKTIHGDLFAGGNNISVEIADGEIDGSLRLAGNEITINAVVKRNALIFGNSVHIGPDAVITGDTHIYASRIVVDGTLAGPATLAGEQVIIHGQLADKSTITAGALGLGADSVIRANTDVYSPSHVTAEPGATGTENITIHQEEQLNTGAAKAAVEEISDWLVETFFFLLIGILLILIWPRMFERVVHAMQQAPGATWAKGALVFFVTPFAIILLCITLIGIPLAIAGLFAYGLALILGHLFTGMYVGYQLVNEKRFLHKTKQDLAYFVVGFFILSLASGVPYVGWLVSLLAAIWGVGGLVHALKRK
jgi:hypothetical protein